MGDTLRGTTVRRWPLPDGVAAEIALIEPNGDSLVVECICRDGGGTEIGSTDLPLLKYLNLRYGETVVCTTARRLVLGDAGPG